MKRKTKIIINSILAILMFILLGSVWLYMPKYNDKGIFIQNQPQNATTSLPEHNNATIEQAIINYSIDNNINYEISLAIADCESKMGKYKINWSGSSAKGIFMFIDSTWNAYCQGDVMNDYHNIKCFAKLFNKYPNWWVCK